MNTIIVGRIYDQPDPSDYRVLVDRIWPRGLSTTAAALDEWCRDIAPSAGLRNWYRQHPQRFPGFRERYLAELDDPAHAGALAHLRGLTRTRLTLLTATRNLAVSPAVVLAERLVRGQARHRPTLTHIRLGAETLLPARPGPIRNGSRRYRCAR